jgi:hypothetical protein
LCVYSEANAWDRYVPQVFCALLKTDTRTTTGDFVEQYTIPALLNQGSTIRIRCSVCTISGTPTYGTGALLYIGANSYVSAISSGPTSSATYIMEATLTYIDSSTTYVSGMGYVATTNASTFMPTYMNVENIGIDIRSLVIKIAAQVSGTGTLQKQQFIVDLT